MEKNINESIQEKQAINLIGDEEATKGVVALIKDSFTSYKQKPTETSLNNWIEDEFRKHPDVFIDEDDIQQSAQEITGNLTVYNDNREDLQQTIAAGKTAESWVIKKIQEGAKAANAINIGQYAQGIDEAIKTANQQSFDTCINLNGTFNANKNLHGFIAENSHVNSFNLDAATSSSQYRAEMLQSTGKNSVDIVIKDMETGKIVKRYGAKYGQSAEDSKKYFDKGDYRGQRKLVADGQELELDNTTNIIEIDGVKSKPLSYEESKKIQTEAQERNNIQEVNWDKLNKAKLAKSIVSETGKMVVLQSLFQGGRILGQRIWNAATGKESNTVNEDLKDWFDSSWAGTKSVVMQSIVTTSVTIAVRKGYLGRIAKNTPAGKIANIVYVGMENAKIMYKMAKGDISVKEGLWKMQETTLSATGGIVGAGVGAAKGAVIGTMMLPGPGTVIGSFIGAIVGGIAGSTVGSLVAKGSRKVAEVATTVIKKAYEDTKNTVNKAFNAVTLGVFA